MKEKFPDDSDVIDAFDKAFREVTSKSLSGKFEGKAEIEATFGVRAAKKIRAGVIIPFVSSVASVNYDASLASFSLGKYSYKFGYDLKRPKEINTGNHQLDWIMKSGNYFDMTQKIGGGAGTIFTGGVDVEFSHTFKGYTAGGYKDQYFGFKTGGLEIKINTKDRILKVTESNRKYRFGNFLWCWYSRRFKNRIIKYS